MANEWFYTKDDQQIGPVSAFDLRAAVASGDLTPTSQVWKEGMAEWKPATKIKGLFDGVPGRTTTVPGSPPPASESSAIADEAPKPSAMSSLLSTAKSAAQLAAKQTEKTKLTTITLPAQYQPLGKHCYESQQHWAEFTDLFQKLDTIRSQLAAFATSTEGKPTPQKLSDKAKATAGKAMQAAQSQKLSMQQSSLFGALGKAVYEAHGENSGPSNLTGPIAASVARLTDLDADISRLSSEGKGSWITPKRLVIAGAVVVCVSVLSAVGTLGNRRQEQTRSETGSSPATVQPTSPIQETNAGASDPASGSGKKKPAYQIGYDFGVEQATIHAASFKTEKDKITRDTYTVHFQKLFESYKDDYERLLRNKDFGVSENLIAEKRGRMDGFRKGMRDAGVHLD